MFTKREILEIAKNAGDGAEFVGEEDLRARLDQMRNAVGFALDLYEREHRKVARLKVKKKGGK